MGEIAARLVFGEPADFVQLEIRPGGECYGGADTRGPVGTITSEEPVPGKYHPNRWNGVMDALENGKGGIDRG